MLKAYDYAEPKKNRVEIQDDTLFQKEKQIAQNFVIEHPNKKKNDVCPICNSQNTKFIFHRWDVNYLMCRECSSIFVPINENTMEDYLDLADMKQLRTSEAYQKQATERRGDVWEELGFWIKYRTFRYLKRNEGLDVIDYGNRYEGLVNLIKKINIASNYELRDSILSIETSKVEKADVVLYLNQLQHETDPIMSLKIVRDNLKDDGILVLNTRLGSGFDILTLKGGTPDIFPYEHVMLPSRNGLQIILEKAGFELLEITTPGTRDMDVVLKNQERISSEDFFIKYLFKNADKTILLDFQQFLQKSGMSSFAQVVARKR